MYNYRFNCGGYVLHKGDVPVGRSLPEVALAFSLESGTLHKHGPTDVVQTWAATVSKKYREAGFPEMADDIIVISGRFPIDAVNNCLTTGGYVLDLYTRMGKGELQPAALIPD